MASELRAAGKTMTSETSLAALIDAPEAESLAEPGLPAMRKKKRPAKRASSPDLQPHPEPRSRRLASLDAFRGLAIVGMLLVNNVALDTATPRPLTHAPWNNGVYFADLVYPWFLFIVGVAIPYSAASHRARGLPLWRYDLKIISRAATLVLLGCLIESSQYKRPTFDLGVLQQIGLAYLVGAMLGELSMLRRLLVAASFLVGHWAAIRFLPIPGVGPGVFTESTNIIYYFNRTYLQPVSLRGLISLVPMSALVLIGTAVGESLRRETRAPVWKAALLLAAGAVLAGIGWLWNLDLPFNKSVWTASYILYSAGLGAVVLALFYLLIDVIGWRFLGFPLIVFGANAMMAYVTPILVKVDILQEWKWRMHDGALLSLQDALLNYCFAHAGRIPGGWLYTGGYILFWWLVLLVMYVKRVFWRV
jgi:predicted acyltransferase